MGKSLKPSDIGPPFGSYFFVKIIKQMVRNTNAQNTCEIKFPLKNINIKNTNNNSFTYLESTPKKKQVLISRIKLPTETKNPSTKGGSCSED